MYGQDANPHRLRPDEELRRLPAPGWRRLTSSRTTGVGANLSTATDAGGGHAHSAVRDLPGDNFLAEYRNTPFTANIHGNRLNNDEAAHALWHEGRASEGFPVRERLLVPRHLREGWPDGARLYVSDWCDTGECHNYDKCDITNGRIYRVSYGDPKQWKGDVSKLTDAELVKMTVTASNEWFSRARRGVCFQERHAQETRCGSDRRSSWDVEGGILRSLPASVVGIGGCRDALTSRDVTDLCVDRMTQV
ncbi:MAG: hypothetical protein U0792_10025 [Gemmataceae bacterium]